MTTVQHSEGKITPEMSLRSEVDNNLRRIGELEREVAKTERLVVALREQIASLRSEADEYAAAADRLRQR
jgi:Mg2+ and Co2+ transporter CorA